MCSNSLNAKSKVRKTMTQPKENLMQEKGDEPSMGYSLVDYFEEVVEMVCHLLAYL